MVVAGYKYFQEFGWRLTLFRIAEVLFDFLIYFSLKFPCRFRRLRRVIFLFCLRSGNENTAPLLQTTTGVPRVGVLIIGGLGDSLFLSVMAGGILRKNPGARLFAFVRNRSHAELFEGSDEFAGIYEVKAKWVTVLRMVAARELEVFHDNRYVVSTSNKLISSEELESIRSGFREVERNWHVFPLNNHLYGELGLSLYELASRSTGMSLDPEDLMIPLLGPEFEVFDTFLLGMGPYRYLTVHHGSDDKMVLPDGSGCGVQTKNWYPDRWADVVSHFNALGYPVIQLGIAGEEPIPGTVNLLGKLSIKQTAAVLKYASFHLDSEGGLVHLAQAVKTRSVVVFGPTPISLFGYPKNANVAAGECRNCFWSDVRWFQRCPKGNPTAFCMDAITPARVIEASEGLPTRHSLPRTELLEIGFSGGGTSDKAVSAVGGIASPDKVAEQWPVQNGRRELHDLPGWEVDFLLDMVGQAVGRGKRLAVVGRGCGELALRFRSSGWQVSSAALGVTNSTDDRYRFLQKHGRDVDFRFSSVFNLPFEDCSLDTIAWMATPQEIAHHKFALFELLRCLKQGGVLTFILPLVETGAECAAEALMPPAATALDETLAELGAILAAKPVTECLTAQLRNGWGGSVGIVLKKLQGHPHLTK